MTQNKLAFELVKSWCKTHHYPLPIDEHPFAKKEFDRNWQFDCCWPELKLVVEFMGSVWGTKKRVKKGVLDLQERTAGRHNRGKGYSNDCEKAAYAAILGWSYIPVTTQQLEKGLLFKWLEMFFERNLNNQKEQSKRN